MNNQRRKSLRRVVNFMRSLWSVENDDDIKEKLKEAADTIERELDAEQDSLDNLPENLQMSQRADDYSDNIDSLMAASCLMESIIDTYETKDDSAYKEAKGDIENVIKNLMEAIDR